MATTDCFAGEDEARPNDDELEQQWWTKKMECLGSSCLEDEGASKKKVKGSHGCLVGDGEEEAKGRGVGWFFLSF